MPFKNLVMDQCQGCNLTLPISSIYVCDCPCKKSLCQKCLVKHAGELHMNYYHIPEQLKKKRTKP